VPYHKWWHRFNLCLDWISRSSLQFELTLTIFLLYSICYFSKYSWILGRVSLILIMNSLWFPSVCYVDFNLKSRIGSRCYKYFIYLTLDTGSTSSEIGLVALEQPRSVFRHFAIRSLCSNWLMENGGGSRGLLRPCHGLTWYCTTYRTGPRN